jgi:hypothetical protein
MWERSGKHGTPRGSESQVAEATVSPVKAISRELSLLVRPTRSSFLPIVIAADWEIAPAVL